MKLKRLLSCAVAAGTAATAFSGLTLTAQAASDSVYFRPDGAENLVTLMSQHTEYDHDSDEKSDVIFDPLTGTVTFSSSMKLQSTEVNDHYHSAIYSTASSGAKLLTVNIPEGVTVTMDNTADAIDWSAALYGGVTGEVVITGGGTLIVTGGGSPGYGISPYEVPITIDGVTVKAEGTSYGVGSYGNGGSLTVTNGGVLEAEGGTAAFEAGMLNIDEDAEIAAGESADSTKTITADQVTDHKYVKITTTATEDPDEPGTQTPTGIRIGEDTIYEESPTWSNSSGVYAKYDKATDTLTLSGTGSINGPGYNDNTGYGAAIYANKPLNIVVSEDSDITLNAGPGAGGWSCGIYTYAENADITIGGEGKLTVNSTGTEAHSIAICAYGKSADNGYDITIKDSVDVTANGGAYGLYAWQNKAGWIRITHSAGLKASGKTKAVHVIDFQEDHIYGGARSFVGTVDGGAWDIDKVMSANSVSIGPAVFEQWTSPAITGSDNSTGFVTTVTGTAGTTIKSIRWHITSSNDGPKELAPDTQPQVTLDEDAQAVFAVIVQGLKDGGATAYAIAE